ncbi:MAG: response regulator [Asgard group archaeon]|nr:response regulator [Asgard group archaeon]
MSTSGKILVMDDDKTITSLLDEILNNLGYDAEFVAHADEALEKYKQAYQSNEPFDLVLMDIRVSHGKDGLIGVKMLKEYNPNVKVIVSSGFSTDDAVQNYKNYGFCDVLLKPYNLDKLSEILEKHTNS